MTTGTAVALSLCVKLSVLDRVVTVVPGIDKNSSVEDVFEHVINGVRVLLRRPKDSQKDDEPVQADKGPAEPS